MRIVRRLILRHRARRTVLSALRFAERLRKSDSEFAPTYADTINGIGDELALIARRAGRDDGDRRAIVAGSLQAFQTMYRGNTALAGRLAQRVAPRILITDEAASPGPTPQYVAHYLAV
jgi:hypothetical protein